MSDQARRLFLPYCLDRQADGRYAVLNRHYKPLGLDVEQFVDYAAHPGCVVRLDRMSATRAAKMSFDASRNVERIFFYNDGCVPTESEDHWSAYSKRLQTFAKFKVG